MSTPAAELWNCEISMMLTELTAVCDRLDNLSHFQEFNSAAHPYLAFWRKLRLKQSLALFPSVWKNSADKTSVSTIITLESSDHTQRPRSDERMAEHAGNKPWQNSDMFQ